MKLMPFTEAVYQQLLDDGYTHLICDDGEAVSKQIQNGTPLTVEAVKNAITAAPTVVELTDPKVKNWLSGETIYYVRLQSDLSQGDQAPSARYTKHVANALQKQYAHLTGHPFFKDGREWGRIEAVAVAPYDELNKWIFLSRYKDIPCPLLAMEFYHVPYFDVVLIVRSHSEHTDVSYFDLSTYLTTLLQSTG